MIFSSILVVELFFLVRFRPISSIFKHFHDFYESKNHVFCSYSHSRSILGVFHHASDPSIMVYHKFTQSQHGHFAHFVCMVIIEAFWGYFNMSLFHPYWFVTSSYKVNIEPIFWVSKSTRETFHSHENHDTVLINHKNS